MFVAPDSVRPPPSLRERDEVWKKQQAFRERVNKDRIRAEFTSHENLAAKITQAIRNWEHEDAVKKRTTCINKSIPLTPNPYFAHPYPPPANFTGRKLELEMLQDWLNNDKRQILALVAMGGMGKSFLSWHWIQNDVDFLDLDGILWWSFYEGESTFSKFLDDAIIYTSGQTVDPSHVTSDFDKTRILVNFLHDGRFLIVLDGFERLLRNYDSTIAEDENNGNFDEFNYYGRACTDHNAARFLRYLADGKAESKILITTRLMIHDLEDQAGNPLKYCYKKELKSFNPDDAVTFMRLQGVTKGTPNEILKACAYYDFHPLSLRLLSGLIARDKKYPGDINTAPKHDVHTSLKARQHHILEVAYKSLPIDWQILLSKASAFRGSIIYDALLTISDGFSNEKEFDKALDGLMDWGLLLVDKNNDRFDLHPIVRRYAYDRLDDKISVHTRLKEYFMLIPTPNKMENLNDLTSTIELCYHSVRAGLYFDAFNIYKNKISDVLFHTFGAYHVCIELLNLFYSKDGGCMSDLRKTQQGWILNELALNYRFSGQQRLAVSIYKIALELADELKEINNLSCGFLNLSESQLRLGELKNSVQSNKKSLEYNDIFEHRSCKDKNSESYSNLLFMKAVIHNTLGYILTYMGSFSEAAHELDVANEFENKRIRLYNKKNKYTKISTTALIGKIYSYRTFRILLMSPTDKLLRASIATSKKARKIANDTKGSFDTIIAKIMVGLSQIKLVSIDENNRNRLLSDSENELREALELCRRTDLVDLEPDILLAWACWHHIKNDHFQALKDAEEAIYIANRFEYRLKQAEIHNFMAQLALCSGDADSAKRHAEIAHERAWCDGPPYCYKPALDEAEEMLRELGEEPPAIYPADRELDMRPSL